MMMNAHNLIAVSHPSKVLDRALLQAPGGFLWWYLDLIDERGDGLVMIWSWGLPFLPGLASAARAKRPIAPADRPSLNICVYRAGKLDAYLLQEYAPEDAAWTSEDEQGLTTWRFGQTTIERQRDSAQVRLDVHLDCAMPGAQERLTGHVRVQGVARTQTALSMADVDSTHDWSPLLGPARGELALRCGHDWSLQVEGRAYHDRNGADRPLHALGFERWCWGRIPFEDHERIFYILWPRGGGQPTALGMTIDAQGQSALTEGLSFHVLSSRRSLAGGLRNDTRFQLLDQGRLWLDLEQQHLIDEGPFYLRAMLRAQAIGHKPTLGFGEYCEPDQVDRVIHRPLVKMRIHHAPSAAQAHPSGDANSLWVPLFTGPQQGRAQRLLKHALQQLTTARR